MLFYICLPNHGKKNMIGKPNIWIGIVSVNKSKFYIRIYIYIFKIWVKEDILLGSLNECHSRKSKKILHKEQEDISRTNQSIAAKERKS